MNQKFRITDIINKAKKKTQKENKYERLYKGLTISANKKLQKSERKHRAAFLNEKLNNTDIKLSPINSINSGLTSRLEDPYWKKQLNTPFKASLDKKYFVPSTHDETTDFSTTRERNIKSTMELPFELKYSSENRLFLFQKHSCGGNLHNRSASVNHTPPKQVSKLYMMDYSLPRDYKVFDVNMSISPFYDQEEKT